MARRPLDERKAFTLTEQLSAVVTDIKLALLGEPLDKCPHCRRELPRTIRRDDTKLRSALFHWLGIMFDEGAGAAKDLQVAYETAAKTVVRLKQINKDLARRISKQRGSRFDDSNGTDG